MIKRSRNKSGHPKRRRSCGNVMWKDAVQGGNIRNWIIRWDRTFGLFNRLIGKIEWNNRQISNSNCARHITKNAAIAFMTRVGGDGWRAIGSMLVRRAKGSALTAEQNEVARLDTTSHGVEHGSKKQSGKKHKCNERL